jgi:glycerol-3-phosphate dehydrogenase
MDDARLVLANVVGAHEAGATTLNHCAVSRWLQRDQHVCGVEVVDRRNGARAEFYAPLVVCCTGPWTNDFLSSLGSSPLEPTRGTHLLVRPRVQCGFTLAAGRDGRIFFVLPWQDATLIGTTDHVDPGSPDAVAPREDEIRYLLDEANRFFPSRPLERSDVVAAFAGLRPLLRASGDASSRSREHALIEPLPGMLCVAGGKYTTYRAVAEQVVDEATRRLGRQARCRTADLPLPGGDVSWTPQEHWSEAPVWQEAAGALAAAQAQDLDWVRHLLRLHGTRTEAILHLARSEPGASHLLCSHRPYRVAEVLFAIRNEMALCLGDWYFRRSTMAYAPCHGSEAVEEVAALFASELGWSARHRDEQILQLREQLADVAVSLAPASTH